MTRARPITFLTDFGYEDEFTGVCRAVIDRIDPGLKVIDVTHGIVPGDVRGGALALANLVHYSAPAVHLAIVDPGVGTGRRALLLEAGEHFFVGPDNGLLAHAADRLGGAGRAFEISESPARLQPTHRTFHGRDIFSPVAAELARGRNPEELGAEIDTSGLVRIDFPEPSLEDRLLVAHVLGNDHYGNLAFNAGPELILGSFLKDGEGVLVESAGRDLGRVPFGSTFGDVAPGEAVLFPDSSGSLSLAVNGGSAATVFGLGVEDELRFRPA